MRKQLIKYLVKKITIKLNCDALIFALRKFNDDKTEKNKKIIETLLIIGTDPTQTLDSESKVTPLVMACTYNLEETVQLILTTLPNFCKTTQEQIDFIEKTIEQTTVTATKIANDNIKEIISNYLSTLKRKKIEILDYNKTWKYI